MKPRPDEIGWWFRISRRQFAAKHIPQIKSVDNFKNKWIQWWAAVQLKWQETDVWPFLKDGAGQDWDCLLDGGKDELFLVVVSLGWWINVRDPCLELKVGDAIADVTWVVDNLVSILSANATSPGSPACSSATASPRPQRKRARSTKTGPPAKCICS